VVCGVFWTSPISSRRLRIVVEQVFFPASSSPPDQSIDDGLSFLDFDNKLSSLHHG